MRLRAKHCWLLFLAVLVLDSYRVGFGFWMAVSVGGADISAYEVYEAMTWVTPTTFTCLMTVLAFIGLLRRRAEVGCTLACAVAHTHELWALMLNVGFSSFIFRAPEFLTTRFVLAGVVAACIAWLLLVCVVKRIKVETG